MALHNWINMIKKQLGIEYNEAQKLQYLLGSKIREIVCTLIGHSVDVGKSTLFHLYYHDFALLHFFFVYFESHTCNDKEVLKEHHWLIKIIQVIQMILQRKILNIMDRWDLYVTKNYTYVLVPRPFRVPKNYSPTRPIFMHPCQVNLCLFLIHRVQASILVEKIRIKVHILEQ